MAAGRYDRLEVEQGSRFEMFVTVPYDLTSGAARAAARLHWDDAESFLDFDIEILSSAATGSRLRMYKSASATSDLELGACPQGFLPGVWNLEVVLAPTADNDAIRVLQGVCKFNPDASR